VTGGSSGLGPGLKIGRRRTRYDGDPDTTPLLRHLIEAAEAATRFQATGEVVRVVGTTVEAAGLILQLGSICWIDLEPEGMVSAEVVGFKDGLITLVPFGDLSGVRPGSAVRSSSASRSAPRSWAGSSTGSVARSTARVRFGPSIASSPVRPPIRSAGPASPRRSRPAFERSTGCSRPARASAWASSPDRASASRRCSR